MKAYFFAALTGAACVLSYAPLEWWWLMPLCLMSLYYLLWPVEQSKQAFFIAFLFGLGQFGVGASWVYVSLQEYGNMPVWMASIAVFFFVAALAFFTGLVGLFFHFGRRNRDQNVWFLVLWFTCLWVIAEWLRSFVLTGFPWLDVGYSQTTRWLSGYAPIGSVYLVSFVTVLCSILAFHIIRAFLECHRESSAPLNAKSVPLILTLSSLIVAGVVLQKVPWSKPTGEDFQVVIVQGNVPVDEKWEARYRSKIIADYVRQIQQYTADLVILPETALPFYLDQVDDRFWRQLKGRNKAILAGVIERNLATRQVYNSAKILCDTEEQESVSQVYRKQHLVPFGEYLPLRSLLNWVLNYLQIPMSDFTAGSSEQVLECLGMQIGLSICYEDAFAAGARQSLPEKSENGVLINISEDAWFGDSLAPHQRVQMAQMRAQELARPMLRSANSGPSTHINFQGEVLASTGQFVKDSMLVTVQPRTGDTPFKRVGLWIIWVCLVVLLMQFCCYFFYRKS